MPRPRSNPSALARIIDAADIAAGEQALAEEESHRRRREAVTLLCARHVSGAELARMAGVSRQYVWQVVHQTHKNVGDRLWDAVVTMAEELGELDHERD